MGLSLLTFYRLLTYPIICFYLIVLEVERVDMGSKTFVFRTEELVMVGMVVFCSAQFSKRLITLMFYIYSRFVSGKISTGLRLTRFFKTAGNEALCPDILPNL